MNSLWDMIHDQSADLGDPPDLKNNWYTPRFIIEDARAVMGSIDLDPASCYEANTVVQAKMYYTKERDGLIQPWFGNVWLNPPWSDNNLDLWLKKVAGPFVTQCCFLVPDSLATLWFQEAWPYTICVPKRRFHFWGPRQIDGKGPNVGSVLGYKGPNEQKFIEVFSKYGPIVKRIA